MTDVRSPRKPSGLGGSPVSVGGGPTSFKSVLCRGFVLAPSSISVLFVSAILKIAISGLHEIELCVVGGCLEILRPKSEVPQTGHDVKVLHISCWDSAMNKDSD